MSSKSEAVLPATLKEAISTVNTRLLPYAREIFSAKDKATALEMAGPYLSAKYQTYAKWGQDEVLPGDDTFRQPFEKLLRDRFVLGSPDECYEQRHPCWSKQGRIS